MLSTAASFLPPGGREESKLLLPLLENPLPAAGLQDKVGQVSAKGNLRWQQDPVQAHGVYFLRTQQVPKSRWSVSI